MPALGSLTCCGALLAVPQQSLQPGGDWWETQSLTPARWYLNHKLNLTPNAAGGEAAQALPPSPACASPALLSCTAPRRHHPEHSCSWQGRAQAASGGASCLLPSLKPSGRLAPSMQPTSPAGGRDAQPEPLLPGCVAGNGGSPAPSPAALPAPGSRRAAGACGGGQPRARGG